MSNKSNCIAASILSGLNGRPPQIKEDQTLVAPAPSSPIYDARRTATDRRAVQCSGRCRSRWSSRSPPPSNNCFRGSGVRVQKDFLRSLARSLTGASFSSLQRSARALSRRSRNCDDGRGRRPREGRLVRFLCVCARCLPSSRRLSRFI